MATKHDTSTHPNHLVGGTLNSAIQRSAVTTIANLGASPVLTRVVVEEVLFDPSMIDNDKFDYINSLLDDKNSPNVRNVPANTIVGRPVRDGTESGIIKSEIFYPFLPPHLMMPIKAGEHVWVFYEQNKEFQYGYWMWRIVEARPIDDLNYTHADRKLDATVFKTSGDKFSDSSTGDTQQPGFNNGPVRNVSGTPRNEVAGATYAGDEKSYETLLKDTDSAKVTDFEEVPRWKKRPGDMVIQGSNNTLISLGTDRTGPATDTTSDPKRGKISKGRPGKDKQKKAGAIDIVVGRGQSDATKPPTVSNTLSNTEVDKRLTKEKTTEGDPDFDKDLGRIYLAMKTDVDSDFNVQLRTVGEKSGEGSAVVVKSDHVRIIGRKSLKLLVQPKFDSPDSECAGIFITEKGDIIISPSALGVIKLGGEDANKALLGQTVGVAGAEAGNVLAAPIISTFIATVGGPEGNVGGGEYAVKVVMK